MYKYDILAYWTKLWLDRVWFVPYNRLIPAHLVWKRHEETDGQIDK